MELEKLVPMHQVKVADRLTDHTEAVEEIHLRSHPGGVHFIDNILEEIST